MALEFQGGDLPDRSNGLLQAIARTNRLHEGKDYGLIVDYRGLIAKLDAAVDMYSGAGLEGFDGKDLNGVAVDVMSAVGKLRSAYSQLEELFATIKAPRDSETVEVFLADAEKRELFYAMQETRETWVRFLGREDPLEKEMTTHSSILASGIPQRNLLGYKSKGWPERGFQDCAQPESQGRT